MGVADVDYYSYTLTAGETTSLALESDQSDAIVIDLFDSAGTLWASGIAAAN